MSDDVTETAAGARVIALLQGDLGRYGDALRQCRDQFAFYAREHEAAGKHEKAATNRRFAKIATDALEYEPPKVSTPSPDSGERMREALRPFAALADEWDRWQEKGSTSTPTMIRMSYGKVRFGLPEYQAARAALQESAR